MVAAQAAVAMVRSVKNFMVEKNERKKDGDVEALSKRVKNEGGPAGLVEEKTERGSGANESAWRVMLRFRLGTIRWRAYM